MTAERLFCKCGREVKIVRLNRRSLTFGHLRNPGPESHPVQLARSAAGASKSRESLGREDIQRQTEGLVRHGGPSSHRRSPRAGRVVPNVSTPVTSSPARGGRVAVEIPPAPTPRPPRAG